MISACDSGNLICIALKVPQTALLCNKFQQILHSVRKMASIEPAVEICLAILIGLPGSGKTSLANAMSQYFSSLREDHSALNVIHICYDELITDYFLKQDSYFDKGQWHNARQEIFSMVRKVVSLLKDVYLNCQPEVHTCDITYDSDTKYIKHKCKFDISPSKHTVIVIDDNMYYRSMRYSYFQLARNQQIGFCQLYLDCSLCKAMDFNNERIQYKRIPDAVMKRMAERMEPPQTKLWEQNSLYLQAPVPLMNKEVIHQINNIIFKSFCSPVKPMEDDFELHKTSYLSSASLLHQADIALRNLIGKHIKSLKMAKIDSDVLKNQACLLNSVRSKILVALKTEEISVPEEIVAAIHLDHFSAKDDLCSFLFHLLFQ